MTCRLLATWLLLAAPAVPAGEADDGARRGVVGVERLDVVDRPDDGGFVTARLAEGDEVDVIEGRDGGWLAIRPPAGSFAWIDVADVAVLRDGRLYVEAATAHLRLGREGLRRLGPARGTVFQGTVFRPADQEPLTVAEGRRGRTWRAVLVPPGEARFVRAAGVADPRAPRLVRRPEAAERRVAHVDPGPSDLPADLAAPLGTIDREHRVALSAPIERWKLDGVRRDYQALLTGRADSTARAAIGRRLDRLDEEEELAKAARAFESIVQRSRQRDGVLEQARARLRAVRDAEELAYDAEGLLQATSYRVDGEKVFAVLDEDGQVVAYVKIPPGIDSASLLARRVGVRGRSRFNEQLRFRLLEARDVEPLDSGR